MTITRPALSALAPVVLAPVVLAPVVLAPVVLGAGAPGRGALSLASVLAALGSPSVTSPSTGPAALLSLRGEEPAERFGTSVACAGDIDLDGRLDWIVGAPRAGVPFAYAGRVSVRSGADGHELLRLEGDSPSDWLGAAVAGVGDVDGDGRPDLLVGAPRGTPAQGSARLCSGAGGATLFSWQGLAPGDEFGRAVAGVGDLDGDGVVDLAVGAPLADRGGMNSGSLTLYSGADGSELRSLDGATWDQLGRSVVGLGDLDGDGLAEVAVGAPLADVGAFNSGSVLVLRGADGSLLYAVHGAGIGDQLGWNLAAGRDVNLDGVGDLLVAAPGSDVGGIDSGAALLVSGVDGALLMTIPGLVSGEGLSAVAMCPDTSGDGRAELLVGAASAHGSAEASGEVRLLSGRDGRLLESYPGSAARDWLGASLACAPGPRLEFIAGAPGHDDDVERPGYAQIRRLEHRAGPAPGR